ncbi:N-6 DNA methylase [Streptomyces pini]|uniref:Type I restriction enzyme M protein n=1 Tax=Streptomyces pini TaxID=1520580 RepID=A0A1I4MJD9_9ACTN|nr:N-6 DNA methylase [Streptomyces pini]SFM03163.1 type I restriction enzyme M protein [Streptomyces pini]
MPDEMFVKVRQHLTQLSRVMNTIDATRLLIGLLYLSRASRVASDPGVPTWSWLLSQPAGRGPEIRAAVTKCLVHHLPAIEDPAAEAGAVSLVPVPPPGSEKSLRALIQAIGSTQQVGTLLDQCLRDLSAAQADGSNYFTPEDMARLMVGAAVPHDRHRVLDPACGSGGLLVESHCYVRERVGLNPTMSLRGRELHAPTSQVARMNLSVRGIEADILPPGDSLAQPEPEPYDIVLANPSLNQRDWTQEEGTQQHGSRPGPPVPLDPRWPEETPPRSSADSAWIQHIAHALAPAGRAVFLMADRVAASRQAVPKRLRERLLRIDLVECVIALPLRVYGHSQAPACLWVINKDKSARPGWGALDRRGQVLFINARRAFEQVPQSRARRLGDKNTALILSTLAAWRGLPEDGAAATPYSDTVGWSRSCSVKEIADREYSLMPTSYAVEPPGPERDTRNRIDQLKLELTEQFDRMRALELRLLDALEEI